MKQHLTVQRREKSDQHPVFQPIPEIVQPTADISSTVPESLATPGQSLDANTRTVMEPHFGHDFSKIRIHADDRATVAAQAVHANAFAVGHHIVFGEDQYMPGITEGQQLIAHELTHTVQQGFAEIPSSGLRLGRNDNLLEAEAHHAVQATLPSLHPFSIAPTIQRALADDAQNDDIDSDTELDASPTAAPAKAAAPTPDFDHSGGKTITINADTAVEFSQNITKTIGSPHVDPVLEPDIQVDFKTDASGKEVPGTKKISAIGLKVKTAITKIRFGLGRPNAENKKAIDEMVASIQAHEEAHRAIIEAEATRALQAAQKFVGTKQIKEADKALNQDLECAMNKKHEALDAAEGLQTPVEQADGSVKITKSASGAKYPCR